ncbi:MAG: sugar-binding domain-containing protein, partial [Planctomycetota bacterium]
MQANRCRSVWVTVAWTAAAAAVWWLCAAASSAHAQATPGAVETGTSAAERMDFSRPAGATPSGRGGGAAESTRDPGRVDSGGGVLPPIRLTPRSVDVPGIADARLDLNGEWGFVHDVPESFDGRGASVSEWDAVRVPGHFAFQGLPRMHEEFGVPVAYRKAFDVPAGWADARVMLRFESVDGLTRLWVNGHPAGENDIATLPSEFDITAFVRPGQPNEITLTVETSLATYWSRRELGGINRDVYLQA